MTDYLPLCRRCGARIEFDTRDGRLVERRVPCRCPPGQAIPAKLCPRCDEPIGPEADLCETCEAERPAWSRRKRRKRQREDAA